jgi:hypothetical protein
VGAFAVLALTGVGFSAFTASATVNGTATAATMGIQITAYQVGPPAGFITSNTCFTWPVPWYQDAPGNFTFYGENAAHTAISAAASNLTPGVYCGGWVVITNVGSVPVNLSAALVSTSNVCAPFVSYDCYDYSGWDGMDPAVFGTYSATNFTMLAPGASFTDFFVFGIPMGSDNGTPSTAALTLVFTASTGF